MEVTINSSQTTGRIHHFVQQMNAERKAIDEAKARIEQQGSQLLNELIPFLEGWEPVAEEKAVILYPIEEFAFYVWYENRYEDWHIFRERPTYSATDTSRSQVSQPIKPDPDRKNLIIPLRLYEAIFEIIGLCIENPNE